MATTTQNDLQYDWRNGWITCGSCGHLAANYWAMQEHMKQRHAPKPADLEENQRKLKLIVDYCGLVPDGQGAYARPGDPDKGL